MLKAKGGKIEGRTHSRGEPASRLLRQRQHGCNGREKVQLSHSRLNRRFLLRARGRLETVVSSDFAREIVTSLRRANVTVTWTYISF